MMPAQLAGLIVVMTATVPHADGSATTRIWTVPAPVAELLLLPLGTPEGVDEYTAQGVAEAKAWTTDNRVTRTAG